MTNAKNVYALMLALVIVLSGCFGMTGDESDAQDSGSDENENTGGTGSTFSGADNLPPVISVSVDSSTSEFYEGADCTTAGISVKARHAMTDWDGTIQQAGWDIDLDGAIDYFVTADEGYTTLEMPMSAMIWYNSSGFDDEDPNTGGTAVLQNSVAFGAQDDDGEFISSDIYLIQKTAYYDYSQSWQQDMSYLDLEPCREFSNPADYNFSYADNPDTVSGWETDYLVDITRTNGQASISWDSIRIWFDGNEEDDTLCNPSEENGSSQTGCMIIQNGGLDDSMWEPGESITLRESNRNLHETRSSQTATIEIMLLNEDSTNDYQTMDAYSLTIN